MPATAGYNEASKRAEQAAKVEADKRAAEEAAKRQILERQRTPGYVSSLDQNPEQALNQSFTARERREISAASDKVQAKADAKKADAEQFKASQAEAKTRGERLTSQSSRINITTGEANIRQRFSPESRFQSKPTRRYTTEYESPYHNQQFGSKRVGDYLRKDEAKRESRLSGAGSLSEFGDILKEQTTRKVYDKDSITRFITDYNANLWYRRGKGENDAGIGGPSPKVGLRPSGIEERSAFGGFAQVTISRQVIPKDEQFLKELAPAPLGLAKDPATASTDVLSNVFTQFLNPGFQGIGLGLGNLFTGGTKKSAFEKRISAIEKDATAQYKPTVEDEFFGRVVGPTFTDIFSGARPTTNRENINRRVTEFSGLLGKENPASVAASLATSFTLALPELALKGVRSGARYIPEIFSAIGKGSKADIGTRISKGAFDLIQTTRSPKSINRFYVNYEKAGELKELANKFDFEEAIQRTRTGAIKTDEVTILREFERQPFQKINTETRPFIVGERTTERIIGPRPSVFGERTGIKNIDDELGTIRLNPEKPATRALSDLVKLSQPKIVKRGKYSEFQGVFRSEGAPKFLERLPYLDDILKSQRVGARSKTGEFTGVFRSEGAPKFLERLPYLDDIIKTPKVGARTKTGEFTGVFRSEGSPRLLNREPNLEDILKKPYKLAGTEASEFETNLANVARAEAAAKRPENILSRLKLPRTFVRRKRTQKTLSASEVTDLFETLEGKKSIEPARNLMTRSEQGRYSGDFATDPMVKRLTKLAGIKPEKKTKTTATREAGSGLIQLVKPTTTTKETKNIQKQIEKNIRSVSGIGGPSKGRKSPFADAFSGGYEKIVYPPGFGPRSFGRAANRGSGGGISNILKSMQVSIPSVMVGTRAGARIGLSSGDRVRSSSLEKELTKSMTGIKFNASLGFGSGSASARTSRSQPLDPVINRYLTNFDIPKEFTNKTRPRFPLEGGLRSKGRRRGRKGKVDAEFRTFMAGDIVGAFLGPDNFITRGLDKKFGKLY